MGSRITRLFLACILLVFGLDPSWAQMPPPAITAVKNFAQGTGLAPGSIATITGTNLASDSLTAAAPYPTSLDNVKVAVNGVLAPIMDVAPGQIDFQIPYETPLQSGVLLVSTNAGQASNSVSLTITTTGVGVYLDGNGNPLIFDLPSNTQSNTDHPAVSGGSVAVTVTGIGAVSPTVSDGVAAPASSASSATSTFTATLTNPLTGQNYAGTVTAVTLLTGTVGQAQIVMQIPATVPTGQYALQFTQGTNASTPVAVNVDQPPSITSLSPSSFVVLGAGGTVTINGANLSNVASVAYVGPTGTFDLTPLTVTATQVTVTVSGDLLMFAGTAQVTAVDSFGNASNALTFTIASQLVFASQPAIGAITGTAYSFAPVSGGITPYACTMTGALPSGVALNPTTCVVGGTPASGTAGVYNYTVNASDSTSTPQTGSMSYSLSVAQALTVAAVPTAVVNNVYTASPVSGGTTPITCSISQGSLPAGLTLNGCTIMGTPTVVGNTNFSLQATDSGRPAQMVTQPETFTVAAVLALVAGPLPGAVTSVSYNTGALASGGITPYNCTSGTLPPGLTLNSATCVIGGMPTSTGLYNFSVTVVDSGSPHQLVNKGYSISVAPLLTLSAPPLPNGVVNSTYPQTTVVSGGTTAYNCTVSLGSLPAGLSLNATACTITGTPTVAGTANFTIHVSDSGNPVQTAGQAYSVTIEPTLTPLAPPLPGAVNTVPYTTAVLVTGGTTPYNCTSGTLPPGLTLNATTCIISGTPTSTGLYNFSVSVVDSGNPVQRTSQGYSISVAPLLTLSTPPLPNGVVNSTYPQTTVVTGGTTAYNCTVSLGSLPAGLSLNATACAITGTPTVASTYNFTIHVADSGNPVQTASQPYSVTIEPTLTPLAPPLPGAVTTVSYTTAALVTGGTTPYSCTSGTLPPGLTLNATSCVIGGTPTSTGLYNFSVSAVDSGNPVQRASQGYSISVAPLLTLSTPPLPNGVVNSTYPQTTVVSGGTTAYNCTVSLGSLPPGLSLNATACAITGTPTVASTYNFTIHVADSGNPVQTASQPYSVTIEPTLTPLAPPLPGAVTTVSYTTAALVTGGTTPYSCTSGTLPPGLTLNATSCVIGGTPTSTGLYNFSVSAVDSGNPVQRTSQGYSISVAPLLTLSTPPLPNGVVNATYPQTTVVSGGTTAYNCTVSLGSLPAGLSLNATACAITGTPTVAATYNFTIHVADSGNPVQTASQAYSIIVEPTLTPLAPPLPGAVTTVSYTTAALVTGGTTPYSCTSGTLPPGLTLNATSCVIGGTPTSTGLYNFSVSAVDSGNPVQRTSQGYSISVAPLLTLSAPPLPNGVVNATYPQTTVASGGTTAYNCTVSLGSLPPGLSLNATACAITGTPTVASIYNFTIRVADSGNPVQTASQAYSITISPTLTPTAPPLPGAVTTLSYTTAALVTGGTTPYTCTSGTLPPGLTLNAATCIISGTPTSTGLYNFSVSAVDSGNPIQRTSQAYSISVAPLLTLSAPPLPNGVVGATYPQTTVVSGGTTAYNCTVSLGALPAGLSLNATACAITGTPTVAGTANFTLHVADSGNPVQTASQAYAITISPALTPTAPPLPGAINTVSYTSPVLVTGGTTPYTCSSGTLPPGLTLNATTCIISGTPTSTGLYNFSVSVVDSGNPIQRTSQSYSISVAPLLTLSAPPLPNGVVGTTYPQTTLASGGTTAYTCTVSLGALPAGLSLNATACAITGTPTTAVTANFTIHAVDSGNPVQTATQAYSVTISSALTMTAPPLPGAVKSVAYTSPVLVAGGTTPYTCSSGTLPPGLTLNASTCVIGGTPASTGLYNFTVSVVDSGNPVQRASQSYSINVASLLTALAPPLPNGITTVAYASTTLLSGGTTPYNCSVSLGSLPAGLTLNAISCVLSGTPTAFGTFNFTLQGADSGSPAQNVSQAYSITVAQVMTAFPPPLPGAVNTVAYTSPATVRGGTTPYTCSVTGGALPTGLSLNTATCVISGTPTAAATYNFTIGGSDSGSPVQHTSQSYSMTIAPLLTSLATVPGGVVNAAYPSTNIVSGGTTPYTCSIASGALPTGLSLGGTTCAVTGTPTATGPFTFGVNYQDSGNPAQSGNRVYNVTIAPALTMTAPPLPGAVSSVSYTSPLLVSGGTGPYTCAVTSGALPTGLSLNTSTCVVSGTPTAAASFNFTIGATDSGSPVQHASQSYSIVVATLLTAAPSPLAGGVATVAYTSMALVTGGTTPYNCTIGSGALPVGMTLNAATCVLSGTPSAFGSYNFVVQASDSGSPAQTANPHYSLTVASLLTMFPPPLPGGAVVGSSYTSPATATGGTAPYTCSVTSGALPTGLTLNATSCIVAGTPTNAATYSFSIGATDGSSPAQTASQAYSLTVISPVQVTGATLPGGQSGVFYTTSLAASGGTGPYGNWVLASGSLPPGLSLNSSTGVINGTPTTATGSPFGFGVTVQDSLSHTSAAQSFTIAVIPPAATTLTLSSSSPTSTFGQSVTLKAVVNPSAATGRIAIYDGLTPLAILPVSAGQAQFRTSLLRSGALSLKAFYVPDPGFAPSQSPALAQTVNIVEANGFQPAQSYAAGNAPDAVAVGDFNGDGNADVAIANAGDNNVSVFLGNGNGTFAPAVNYPAGAAPSFVAAIDFNNDGVSDLVVTNHGGNTINVLIGNGDGTFQAAVPTTVGNGPAAVASADFDNDGVPDFVIVNQGDNNVTVANGMHGGSATYPAGTGPVSVATGDFNHDGNVDLAIANYGGGNVSILLGNGDGTFAMPVNYPVGTGPAAIVARDFNNDGNTDLAVVNTGSNNLSVLLGNGDANGTFQAAANYPAGSAPVSLTVGDFNGDGKPDLAAANGTGVSVLLGTGTGTFGMPANTTITGASSLAAGEFNRDGRTDLAVAANPAGLTILLGAVPGPLSVSASALPGGFTGVAYAAQLAATGGIPPYTLWAVASGALPAGLSLNSATGAITGMPATMTGSPFSFTVTVTDSLNNVSAPQGLSIPVGAPLTMLAPPLPSAVAGVGYAATLATGGTAPYTCYVTAGALPAGISLNPSTCMISGMPSAAGLFSFTIGAADTSSPAQMASQAYSLNVATLLTLASSPLTSGVLNAVYSATLATGGASPYSCSITAGALPAGVTLTASTCALGGTPTAAGPFSFTVRATDSGNPAQMATQAYTLNVATLLTLASSPLTSGVLNAAYSATLATGGASPYSCSITAGALPAGVTLTASTCALGGAPTASGAFSFTVHAADSGSPAQIATQAYSLAIESVLSITTGVLPPATSNTAYTANLALNGGTSPFTWSVALGTLPAGLTLNSSTGAIGGTAPAHGAYSFTVQVQDAVQSVQKALTLNVYDPLNITTTSPLPGGTKGSAYGPVNMSASGGSGTWSWSAMGLPGALSMSSAGQITGTPSSAGTFQNISVTVTDTTAAQTTSKTFSLSVAYPPLQISGDGNLGEVAVGGNVSKSFSATGGQPPYTYSGSGLPAGLTLDPNGGSLTGSAMQAGNFTFTVQATDAQPVSITATATLSVLGITTTALPDATTLSPYSQNLAAAGGAQPYTFSANGLPAGLSLSSAGLLTGTAKTTGNYSLMAQVTDANSVTASATIPLTVTGPSPLTVTGGALPGGTVAVPYSNTLAANGGAAPYSWSITAGTLPPGLSAASAGTIAGTPTTAGSFSFTATATDSSGAAVSGVFTIAIAPPPLTVPGNSTLPNGIVGSDYFSQILTPLGGVPPYTFAVTAGTLPAGLGEASGQITGTPTTSGTSNFMVTVTDSANATANSALQITINPAQANLLLASAALQFSLDTGAAGLPAPASVPVRSSVVAQILNYTVSVSPAAPWLDVDGGGTTPGSVAVSLDPTAVSLSASATPYQATIIVTCVAPSPCAGSAQTVTVALTVTDPPPQLSATSALLSFSAMTGGTPVVQTLGLQNTGGGSLGIQSVTPADGWVGVAGVPGAIAAGPGAVLSVTVDPTGLAPGYYRSTINIVSSAGSANVPVAVLVSQNASVTLSPAGTQFTMQAGGAPGNPNGSFLVAVSSSATVNWTAAVQPGANWLVLNTASGSSTSAVPGAVGFSIDPNAAAALAPQAYYGTIRIASSGVVDTPEDFEVVLNVVAATDPVKPDPEPPGLIFISPASGVVPSQTVQVFASSTAPLAYQASAGTVTGNGWLSVSPAMGTASSGAPGQSSVSVNTSLLPPGVYRGGVSYAFSSAAVRTVNVTLIVRPTPAQAVTAKATPGCTPANLVPTQTGLVNNFAQPTAWPTPLSIKLLNDCGAAVTNGQVVATFSNNDPPLALAPTDTASGVYSATWTPRTASAQVTIQARATAAGFSPATAQITGQVAPNKAPLLTPNGTLHVFDPLVGGSLGPGNIVQIYGSNLAAQTQSAANIPLPQTLNGTSVIIGGVSAPLYFVSAGQINAQVPFELTAGQQYQIIVNANGALTTPDSIQLTAVSPGIAAFPSGQIIAQHLDGTLVSGSSPAAAGEIIVFYMAGMGLTNNPVQSGAASPGTPLALPLDTPTLTLNGETVPLLFAGLTPGLVGLYQVNFAVPADAPAGDLQLVVSQNGVASNMTVLPVKH